MSTASLTLEDIHSLSDEVSLLVRAGLPLEHNLAAAGKGYGTRLKGVTEEISEALRNGQSLTQVMQQQQSGASRMLTAAVAAGIQSGELATTVEMMGEFAGDLVELRRQILQAMTYPLMILGVAWALFVIIMQHALVVILNAILQLRIQINPVLQYLLELNRDYPQWSLILPVCAVVVLLFWMISGRANSMAFRGPERLLLLIPGMGSLIRDLQFYTLTRMLALLVEKRLPLHDALQLAGAACGSSRLDSACRAAAARIVTGSPGGSGRSRSRWRSGQLPPLLQVCLEQTSLDGDRFVLRLRALTLFYRNRLDFQTAWLKTAMPFVLLVVVGGGAVLLYSTALFWPVIEIYRNLGIEKG